ncbi:MAG: VOC family protein [Fimbriimonadaceae bacterium]
MAKHMICHIEWQVTDIERAQAFYGGLFEWKFESFGPEMVIFGTGTQHLGGLQKTENVVPGASPSVWIEVESVDSSVADAQRLGGSVVTPKHTVPHVGWSAVVGDPDGNHVGLVQFDKK